MSVFEHLVYVRSCAYMEVQVFVLSEVKTCLHLHGGGVRGVTHWLQPSVTELDSACLQLGRSELT